MTESKAGKRQTDAHDGASAKEQMLGQERIYVPDVDILENADHVRLLADMAGVDRESVTVTVENNVLTLEGVATLDVPDGYESVGREYGVGRYRRDFTLSDDVSPQGIKARVSHGVLAVTIPKREEVKTRTIAIEA